MKHVTSGIFTTAEESIQETLQEISDVIAIAKKGIQTQNSETAIKNLESAEQYIKHVVRKVNIALRYVPKSVQEKEFL
ncbi:MAG: hypothetical protein J6T57_02505 [Alphaproteobacteria bacterium]|nr:hypothetical protein [Alphaproteobacteria bacterium]